MVEELADLAESLGDDQWEEERQALRACIGRLAPKARSLLMSRYAEGLKPAMIAKQTKRSVNAVSVSLSKSLGFLRNCVGRAMRGEAAE